jgi:hypothetical protein
MLLLHYLQLRSRFAWSLSNLLALLRMNLFTDRHLCVLLDQPYSPPPPIDVPHQEVLALGESAQQSRGLTALPDQTRPKSREVTVPSDPS